MMDAHLKADVYRPSTRSVILETLAKGLAAAERVVLLEQQLPVCANAVVASATHTHCNLALVEQIDEVDVDVIAVSPADRYAVAAVIGGRSSEGPKSQIARTVQKLVAAEFTLVDHLKKLGFVVEVALVAVLAVGETTAFPDEIVARNGEIDSLFDVPITGRLISSLRSAALDQPVVHRPRLVGYRQQRRTPRSASDDNARTPVRRGTVPALFKDAI